MSRMITKKQLIQHFESASDVARFFGVSRQAVHRWADAIPARYEYELNLRLPHVFPPALKPERAPRRA